MKLYEINPAEKKVLDSSEMAPMFFMGFLFFLDCNESGKCQIKKDLLTPTNETKQISKWNARKILVKVMGMTSSAWYTKDWKDAIDADKMRMKLFAKAAELFLKSQGTNPGNLTKNITDYSEQIMKEYGAVVLSEASVSGMKTSSKVISIESKDISDALFAPPAGYKVVKEDFGAGMNFEDEEDDQPAAKKKTKR